MWAAAAVDCQDPAIGCLTYGGRAGADPMWRGLDQVATIRGLSLRKAEAQARAGHVRFDWLEVRNGDTTSVDRATRGLIPRQSGTDAPPEKRK